MANPVNWLIFEIGTLVVVSGIMLVVALVAGKQAKSYGINGQ
jgi:hypothetical protein